MYISVWKNIFLGWNGLDGKAYHKWYGTSTSWLFINNFVESMPHCQEICNKQKKYNILAILSKDTQCGSHNDLGLYYCCLNVQNLMVNVLLLYSSLVCKDGFNFLWCKASRVKRCFHEWKRSSFFWVFFFHDCWEPWTL